MGCFWSRSICRDNGWNTLNWNGDAMEKSIRIAIVVLIIFILATIVYHLQPKSEHYAMNNSDSEYILKWLKDKHAEDCVVTPVSKNIWHCRKSNGEKYIIKR